MNLNRAPLEKESNNHYVKLIHHIYSVDKSEVDRWPTASQDGRTRTPRIWLGNFLNRWAIQLTPRTSWCRRRLGLPSQRANAYKYITTTETYTTDSHILTKNSILFLFFFTMYLHNFHKTLSLLRFTTRIITVRKNWVLNLLHGALLFLLQLKLNSLASHSRTQNATDMLPIFDYQKLHF